MHVTLAQARSRPANLAALLATLAVTLCGCASTPAEDDPVQIKLNDLEARVARMERVVSNQSLVQMAQNQDALQAEVRKLRGRIEELEYNNEAIRKQQHDLYSDLDKRVGAARSGTAAGAGSAGGAGAAADVAGSGAAGGSAASAGGTASAPAAAGGVAPAASTGGVAGGAGAGAATGATAAGGGAAGSGQPPSSVEQAVYNQAFEALKAGSYSVAITGFKDFLSSYPASPLAENAQYWLGEAYYVTRDYDGATGSFRTVLQKWPQSRKAPDAMLKIGFTQFEQKKFTDSRKTLEDVIQKFPDSDASKLAAERLKRIPASAR